jgi:hypothetical protein
MSHPRVAEFGMDGLGPAPRGDAHGYPQMSSAFARSHSVKWRM